MKLIVLVFCLSFTHLSRFQLMAENGMASDVNSSILCSNDDLEWHDASSRLTVYDYIPFVTPNKFWFYNTYNGNDANPPIIGAFVLYTGEDTMINNMVYTKLMQSNLKGQHPCQFGPCFVPYIPYQLSDTITKGYLREDVGNMKVYLLPAEVNENFCDQIEYEVYDFSIDVNDHLSTCLINIVTGGNTVDSIPKGIITSKSIESIYGKDRMVSNFNGVYQTGLQYTQSMKLIEGVGIDTYNGFYYSPNTYFSHFCEGSLNDCNILSTTYDAPQADINVYPNPFSSEINIVTDAVISDIKIFNTMGQMVYKGRDEKHIDLSNASSGLYYLEMNANGHKQIKYVAKN